MVKFPGTDERTVIIGATGSGKTQFGVFLLSTRDFHLRRWFILDFKGEKLFPRLNMTPWDFGDKFPEEPGLYWVRVLPGDEEKISQLCLDIYNHENCGLYIDEGMQLPKDDRWFKALLTQGRSKNIEVIVLTQRPARVDLSIFSEASYFCCFFLNVKDDKKRVSEFMGDTEFTRLPKYHSLWYDISEQQAVVFEPCPDAETIISKFRIYEDDDEAEEIGEEEQPKRLTIL